MANLTPKTISELPTATALTGAELVPVSQGGASKKTTARNVCDYVQGTFEVEIYRVVDGGTIPAGVSTYTPTVTKTGYYPVGLVGFRSYGNVFFTQYRVKTASVGSAELEVRLYNQDSATTGTIAVNILWMKTT